MCNYCKTIRNIVEEMPDISTYLRDAKHYYAHIPKVNSKYNTPETLEAHTQLVIRYFLQLIEAHHLDAVIDKLIYDYLESRHVANVQLSNFIKQLFVDSVVFHDFGKVNENFQAHPNKMNNPLFRDKYINSSPISTYHAALGAFLFVCKHLEDVKTSVPKQDSGLAIINVLLFSYPIFKHHSRHLLDNYEETISFKNNIDFQKKYLDNYHFIKDDNVLKKLTNTNKIFENRAFAEHIHSFSLYSLLRLNFSLLTAADYLATNEYMNAKTTQDLGVLSPQSINNIFEHITQSEWLNQEEQKRNYNKATYALLASGCYQDIIIPTEKSADNLNVLRTSMALDVIQAVRNNYDKNLFYIEAPTGGGKTNLSLLATIELLKKHEGNINKVFYIFPFITLINQTYSAIKEVFGVSDNDIIALHSKSGFKQKKHTNDDVYGHSKYNMIDYMFVNFPICLLTHIKFFDLIKTNIKEQNYLLHRLANSVVVIDELQAYAPNHWDKIIYFIKQYADLYNIKFILMSATLPKLDKLKVLQDKVDDFVYLLSKSKERYFQNPNFSDRISFDFGLCDKKVELEDLCHTLLQASKEYAKKDLGQAKPKNSVYTVIEFIYKRSATDFYQIVSRENDCFDKILLLSGTILEHKRREIINILKNKDNRKKRILLITTQVVEAGVDIDMDLGFKDTSLIDSDEQLAGRINRNLNKTDCKLYLFNMNHQGIIYSQDKRYALTKKHISQSDHKRILEKKDFDYLYDMVMKDIDEWNDADMAVGIGEYELLINHLRFESVHKKFQLIENEALSCFIPLRVPVYIESVITGKNTPVFSKEELLFLGNNGIYMDEDEEIDGEDVFDLYINLINNKIDYAQQKINMKILQGIMSKYVFSLFKSKTIEQQIVLFSDEEKSEYGYKYIDRWQEFYNVEFGLDANRFNSDDTQYL